ncbi:Phytochelatin synthase-domain-containing protein [Gilbertella persicaria]|uniref:Phytochelatin synthase-domain-containing protein n=1 Tax=Gilbertella persicaria TaxID=101096 RepID=UPI0022201CFF|nr:Phytochelatin synthase-domain-containing protein [Gilbertella persicaria]KAI8050124.1 Phytochelatin synthase-domain-containing protein [Gilbertella persicaria]
MASRTLFSNTCFKSSLIKQATKKNLLNNNKTTIFPGAQASRQATTTTGLVDNSTKYGRVSYVTPFKYTQVRDEVHLVKFTSVEGKRLFRNAMVQGRAESFFKLMGNFSTQSSPTQGGVSSLAMVLNALEIDPKKIWKGNWRWFSSEQMQTCSPAESIQERGIPFDEFTCLAQAYCQVQSRRGASYKQFLSDLESVTSDSNSQMVVHYSRFALGQQDLLAHFSPIGGYNKSEDQVLIMDVARGKYPSVWVNTKALYRAMMAPSHEEAGRSRGYFVLSRHEQNSKPDVAFTNKLKCKDCSRKCHANA